MQGWSLFRLKIIRRVSFDCYVGVDLLIYRWLAGFVYYGMEIIMFLSGYFVLVWLFLRHHKTGF